MSSEAWLILLAFVSLAFWIVVSRFRILRRTFGRRVGRDFILAIIFVSISTPINNLAPFPFVLSHVSNTLQVVLSVLTAYLFYDFGLNMLEVARSFQPRAPFRVMDIPFSPGSKINPGTVFLSITLFICVLFEFFIAGNTNDTLSNNSIHIKGNFFLLASRLTAASYISFAQTITALYFFWITRTNYGGRPNVRVRAWAGISGLIFGSVDTLANAIATTLVFIFGEGSRIANVSEALYRFYDDRVLFALAVCLLVAAGPTWLAQRLARLWDRIVYWHQIGEVKWLRDILVQELPQVALNTSSKLEVDTNNSESFAFLLTRTIIECSDAIHLLSSYLSVEEWNQIAEAAALKNKNAFEIEALIILKALERKNANAQTNDLDLERAFVIPSLSASSVSELVDCYYRVSKYMRRLYNQFSLSN